MTPSLWLSLIVKSCSSIFLENVPVLSLKKQLPLGISF